MSSRILRTVEDSPVQPETIQWRTYGQAAAPHPASSAGSRAGDPKAADAEQVKQMCAKAYQQGAAAGEAAGAQKAQARLDPAIASFSAMVQELSATRRKLRIEAETAAVALAMEVARRVLHREVAADPEAILGLVKAAFQKCDARATERLRVSPQDAESIREHRARLNFPERLEVVADRSLARGSAIFETSRGDLDVSVDTQLAEIDRGLTDVLKRRTS